MYLKNLFNTRKGQIAATIGSLAFGLYNLYILGREDEIEELCGIADEYKDDVRGNGVTLKMKRMDDKGTFPLHVSKGVDISEGLDID